MITSGVWSGKRYAVLGLARSGKATVDALLASGAEVVAWDSDGEVRDRILPGTGRGTIPLDGGGGEQAVAGLSAPHGAPNPLHHASAWSPSPRSGEDFLLADPLTIDLSDFDAIVVSPGVPLNTHPIAAAARAAGVPLIGDIELFAQARASLPPHKVVGITGTNGKSTTTALVHHILREVGVPTTMGGNIGLPILAQEPLPEGGVYVLELSSYQIDLTHSLDCDVAVLLNITPDHLDRYENFEAYSASKRRLLDMQSGRHPQVISRDSPASYDEYEDRWFDDHDRVFDVSADQISDASAWPALRGPHNAENAAAAIAVCRALDLQQDTIETGLASYPGLPHRMERVANRGGTIFVNDSKATNPTSTAPALAAFDAVHWILGGRGKSDDLDACVPHFSHVRAAYAIGEAAPLFVRLLTPHMPVSDCGTLSVAVRKAADAAGPGEVVLLSPACASFDQFRDFEDRGDAFRAAVEALA